MKDIYMAYMAIKNNSDINDHCLIPSFISDCISRGVVENNITPEAFHVWLDTGKFPEAEPPSIFSKMFQELLEEIF